MVTICTASLTFNNSTFCPHSVFMCFVWIWEQTAIISLYSINWLVFITEWECVFCAVRAQYLNITHFNLILLGCSIAPLASHRFLTMEVRVRFQAIPFGLCSEQSGTGSGFSSLLHFSLSVIFRNAPHSSSCCTLLCWEGQAVKAWETFKKQGCLKNLGTQDKGIDLFRY